MNHIKIYGFMSLCVYQQNHAEFERLATTKQSLEVWIASASISETV